MTEPTPIPDAAAFAHGYWSLVSIVLGACIGSFLNVVIYRWSHGLSIRHPSRSFCPHCGGQLSWHDNIPVISYVRLGGRCRSCRGPISLQYPLVELATAFLFVMTYDVFFVARQRVGIGSLETDWPMLLAHWALWAGMLVMAVMDLEAYTIDIRVTWVVVLAGVVAHAFWTPASSNDWIRPGPAGAAMAVAAAVGLAIGAILFLRRRGDEPPPAPIEPEPVTPASTPPEPERMPAARWLWLMVPCLLVAGYVVAMSTTGPQAAYESPPAGLTAEWGGMRPTPVSEDRGAIRLLLGFVVVYASLTLVASRPQPEADAEIVEAIHAEAVHARGQAAWELRLISPAIILGSAALWAALAWPQAFDAIDRVLQWQPMGTWRPLWGLSTALSGWIIGGAVAWIARIVFTLVLGKEALGMGDIHLMGAAGAVAGWPATVLGFFAAAFLTLGAVLVIQFRRQSRAVAYVPWLALGFLLCSIFQDRILDAYHVRPWLAPGVSSRAIPRPVTPSADRGGCGVRPWWNPPARAAEIPMHRDTTLGGPENFTGDLGAFG